MSDKKKDDPAPVDEPAKPLPVEPLKKGDKRPKETR
jgi:hypothetical protein